MWWQCPAWRDIRERHLGSCGLDRANWPPCLRICGIVPTDRRIVTKTKRLPALTTIDLTADESDADMEAQRAGPHQELWVGRAVVVYTDGATRHNANKALRYAGYGAFWSHGHPFNLSMPLRGEQQTNN